MPDPANKPRCRWASGELYEPYHDSEWGVPVHDDRRLFEFLILEGAQAGLSWITILKKRVAYRKAFDRFDARKVARYDDAEDRRAAGERGHRAQSSEDRLGGHQCAGFLAVQKEFGSFDRYIWGFVDGRPVQNRTGPTADLPARTAQSDAMSKDLARRGFKFVGSTICYAFMQAVGMVNDHAVDCFRYSECQ